MWPPFFFGTIPTYGVLPYAMIMFVESVGWLLDYSRLDSCGLNYLQSPPQLLWLACSMSDVTHTTSNTGCGGGWGEIEASLKWHYTTYSRCRYSADRGKDVLGKTLTVNSV